MRFSDSLPASKDRPLPKKTDAVRTQPFWAASYFFSGLLTKGESVYILYMLYIYTMTLG